MMSSKPVFDAAVIGGGPAGSTVATYLAKQGHNVLLLEKEKFPREHVGESLLPFCYNIFRELGVLEQLSHRFVRKPGVRFIDVDGEHYTTWCFGHVLKDESYLSFHVLRAEFDQLLLENARKHGASVKEETAVKKVVLDRSDGLVELNAAGPNGREATYRSKFLIDASGRDTFLASRNRWKKPHKELDRIAFSTHWKGGKYTEGIEEGLLQIVYLGGEKKGWIWVIPVGLDRLSIGVVLNNAYVRAQKQKLQKNGVEDWATAFYQQEILTSNFVRQILADARIVQPLMINGDYSYLVEKKYGSNFAIVGDASTFIDPIFASGVYLSMNSARLLANALHAKFTSANGKTEDYLEPVYKKINGAYGLVDKAIRLFYNPTAINFAQVGSAKKLFHKHEHVLSIGHYLLAGDFFDRHEQYSEFIDLLQDPKMFRRYKKTVIDRAEFQSTSCRTSRSEVFSKMLSEHEERREKMLAEMQQSA